jgi:hypothetical protein
MPFSGPTKYPIGVKVSDKEFDSLKMRGKRFHADWNYCLLPDN